MKEIILHIGRGKTGTTTIQAALSRNRARLRERGIAYLAADDAERDMLCARARRLGLLP